MKSPTVRGGIMTYEAADFGLYEEVKYLQGGCNQIDLFDEEGYVGCYFVYGPDKEECNAAFESWLKKHGYLN